MSRQRLEILGNQVRQHTLTFIKSPAGYGKSSLLNQWFHTMQEKGVALGWLSLDRTQDDLSDFFRYVAAALQYSVPTFGEWLNVFLDSSQEPSVADISNAFINAIAATEEDIVLFLDDFHLVSDEQVYSSLAAILENPPDNLHLVIASRQSLSFSISRLRTRGLLKEIDGELLRFDSSEVVKFIELAGHMAISREELETLMVKSEGWAAGIQLATIALGQTEDRKGFFSRLSGDRREFSEYLADEVIARLPDNTIDFLLKTSILLRLNPDLCTELTGNSKSQLELEYLQEKSLFLYSLDDERIWFRYHHLFSEFLLRRLRDRYPEMVTDLHRKASDWFGHHGFVDEAYHHAIEADDPVRAAKLLDQSCSNLFYKGQQAKLLRWSKQIPQAVLADYPRVQLEIAWSIIVEWRFRDAEKIINDVEYKVGVMAREEYDSEWVEAITKIVLHRRMMLYLFMDDMPRVEKIILEMIHDFPSDDPNLRGNMETCLIYARREMYRLDNVDKMDVWAREFYERSGSIYVLVWHESVMGPTYHQRGDTDLAERSLRSAMEIAERIGGSRSTLVAMPALLLADILYQRNQVEQAAELIERHAEEAEKQGFVDHLVAFYLTKARLQFRAGQSGEAQKTLDQGQLSAERRGFERLGLRINLERIRQSLRAADLSDARRFLDQLKPDGNLLQLKPGNATTTRHEALVLAWCRVSCALGSAQDTKKILRDWVVFVRDRGNLMSEVTFLIALTVSHTLSGSEGEALRTLREAVKKAAKPCFIRCFVDEGPVIEGLLRKLFSSGVGESGTTTEFGLLLINSIENESATRHADIIPASKPAPDNAPPEALNQHERDVLKLVAVGMSDKEIARRLGLTGGSVKWYMQQIFMKLHVRRRTMAVCRAQQFGMI